MKRILLSLILSFVFAFQMHAMDYEEARQRAWFLTDKMAYELNLTQEQYDRAYEINLEYLMSIRTASDCTGYYWQYRDMDLRCVLFDWQYTLYSTLDYFFRPIRWVRSAWYYPVWQHYRHNYYYFDRPTIYVTYRGGGWSHRRQHDRSPYYGMHFDSHKGMRDHYNKRHNGSRPGSGKDNGNHNGFRPDFGHNNGNHNGSRPGSDKDNGNHNGSRPDFGNNNRPGSNDDKHPGNSNTTRPGIGNTDGNVTPVFRPNYGGGLTRPNDNKNNQWNGNKNFRPTQRPASGTTNKGTQGSSRPNVTRPVTNRGSVNNSRPATQREFKSSTRSNSGTTKAARPAGSSRSSNRSNSRSHGSR